jgi:hypothetical protein
MVAMQAPRMRLHQTLAVVTTLIASTVAVSCGGKSPAPVTRSISPWNLLSNADVNKAPAGSPERALFNWCQAVQFGDVSAVLRLTAPATLASLPTGALEHAILTIGSELGRPKPVETRISGNVATIRVLLLLYPAGKSTAFLALPTTFTLTHTRGAWRMDDVGALFAGGNVPKRTAARH